MNRWFTLFTALVAASSFTLNAQEDDKTQLIDNSVEETISELACSDIQEDKNDVEEVLVQLAFSDAQEDEKTQLIDNSAEEVIAELACSDTSVDEASFIEVLEKNNSTQVLACKDC